MLMSGLQIFNARRDLYWDNHSRFQHPLVSLYARETRDGQLMAVRTIAGRSFDTIGFLGVSRGRDGMVERGFPGGQLFPVRHGSPWQGDSTSFFAWIFVLNGFSYVVFSFDAQLHGEFGSERNTLALLQTIPGIDLIGAALRLVAIGTE